MACDGHAVPPDLVAVAGQILVEPANERLIIAAGIGQEKTGYRRTRVAVIGRGHGPIVPDLRATRQQALP